MTHEQKERNGKWLQLALWMTGLIFAAGVAYRTLADNSKALTEHTEAISTLGTRTTKLESSFDFIRVELREIKMSQRELQDELKKK